MDACLALEDPQLWPITYSLYEKGGNMAVCAQIQSYLPQDFEYIFMEKDTVYHDEENFSCTFRIQGVNTEEKAKEWLHQFWEVYPAVWRISRTYPNTGHYNVYRVTFRCSHNTRPPATRKNSRISKNTSCTAILDVTVKRFVPRTRCKNPDALREDWPCFVKLQNIHNHSLTSAEVLRFRPMSDECRDKLVKLYQMGHTVGSARRYIIEEMKISHPDDFQIKIADGKYLPSVSICHSLFKQTIKKMNDEKEMENRDFLKTLVEGYNKDGAGKIAYRETDDGELIIAVCTPIMRRAHLQLKAATEVCIVDALNKSPKRNFFYLFVTPTVMGGIPLGAVITSVASEAVFEIALQLLKECVPEDSCFGSFGPSAFMTDGDLKVQMPLKKFYPQATNFLGPFHVLRATWAWLLQSKNKIDRFHREELYFMFKRLVHAATEEELKAWYDSFKKSDLIMQNQQFANYVATMWNIRREWSACYKSTIKTCDHDATSYVDPGFRIIKDCLLDKVKKFTVVQLTDFVASRYEAHIQQRLLDLAQGKFAESLARRYELQESATLDNITVHHLPGCYIVPSENLVDVYIVDAEAGICTCPGGCTGRPCKHMLSVLKKFPASPVQYDYDVSSQEFKNFVFELAMGIAPAIEEAPQPDNSSDDDCNDASSPVEMEITDPIVIQIIEMPSGVQKESEDAVKAFKKFASRVCDLIEKNPDVFIPAAKEMIKNAEMFAATETDLAAAMHTFGRFQGLKMQNVAVNQREQKRGQMPALAPIGGRRLLPSPRKRCKTRPDPQEEKCTLVALENHDYTLLPE